MGFGYLLIGYLCTFVLYLTVAELGFGGLALLMGYGVMMYGLWTLNHYHRAFVWAKWLQLPLLVTAVYDLLASLDEMLLWDLPLFGATVYAIYEWISFTLILLFNLAMLYAIRMIAGEVGLHHIATKAIRNSLLVILYAVLSFLARLPIEAIESIANYLVVPVVLTNIVMLVCNILLLVSCNKNICRAGDEDQPAKRSRFEWLNRIGDAYEKNRQKAIDSTRQEAEAVLRRRQEARRSKNSKKKK